MGSVSLKIGDGTARFNRPSICSSAVTILMLLSVLTTNLFAFYAFTYSPKHQTTTTTNLLHYTHKNMSLISEQVSLIMREIGSSQKELDQMEKDLVGFESIDLSKTNIAIELRNFLQHYNLPLGIDSRTGITKMVSSVGHPCEKSLDLLSQYMNYKINGPCPDDWNLGQKLILKGCEPLPRRRCFANAIPKMGLLSFPFSLWNNVSEKIYSWTGLSCKTLSCLNSKKLNRDCAGCFDIMKGYETQKYIKSRMKTDFLIHDVLAVGIGGIRVAFDIGGGSGTFAARMAERNIVTVTATLNVDAPFNEFIAARGLFPLYISLDYRFPFYDNVFDLVRVANGLDVGGHPEKLEFLMFDIDRILRAGGLLWLDNFYCSNDGKKGELTRLIERFGYRKEKWIVGGKINGRMMKNSRNFIVSALALCSEENANGVEVGLFGWVYDCLKSLVHVVVEIVVMMNQICENG